MTAPHARIVIAGLGPGSRDLRTLGVQHALDAADHIILRTRIHPGIEDLVADPRVTDCDDLYQSANAFDLLYPAIAAQVLERASAGGLVVFAVPGHPRFGERAVPLIEASACEVGIPLEMLDGVSFIDVACAILGVDPVSTAMQITDAEHLAATVDAEPFASGLLGVDPARPLLVAQIYNGALASAVKLALSRVYPDDHTIALVKAAGVSTEQETVHLHLHELDRQVVDHLTSLYVPALAPLAATRSSETLARVVAYLRAPAGCPWDREQTHASLRDALLEEVYEAVDAIDAEDDASLVEELGDLLLLVMMHAQIAEEDGAFRIEDVYEEITRKLIRRHPHVFADVTAETPDDVIATWEGVKATERAASNTVPERQQPIDRLPRSMPATRKVLELVAPRAVLVAPEDPSSGDPLLDAVRALIARGLDPERALEASLRRYDAAQDDREVAGAAAATGTRSKKGQM
jgi:tetrapyrrole methylase family protein / MazG family protein